MNDSSTNAAESNVTSGGTASAIQDAIDGLDGAPGTIYIKAGEFSLGGIVYLHEGVEIIGTGAGSTTINTTGDNQWLLIPDGADNCRISGIKFVYPNEGEGQAIQVGGDHSDTILDFRIDNCEFHGYGYRESAIKIRADARGVIDHNYFENTQTTWSGGYGYGVMYDGDNVYTTDTSKYLGTANNVFIEDNEFRYCRHSIAANRGAHYVFRYNWCHDGILGQQVDAHGGYNSYDCGTILADVYNNVIEDYTSGVDRVMKFRGGQFIVHDNYSDDYNHFIMLELESGTTFDMALTCKIHDSYEWNNTGVTDVYVEDGTWPSTKYIHEGTDYFTDTRHPTYTPYTYPHPLVQKVSIPINNSPVAGDDSYSTDQEDELTIGNPGVLSNDSDPEGDTLSAVLISGTSHGFLILNADGSFNYTPALGFSGTDSFSYKSTDGINTSKTAIVNITVFADAIDFGLGSGSLTFNQEGDALQAMRFQNTSGEETLDSLSILFDDTTPNGKVRLGIYADNSGAPGALLLDAGETTVQNGWVSIDGLNLSVEQNAYYWLSYNLQESNGVRYQSDQPDASHYWVRDYAYGDMPGQFPSGSLINNNQYVMRALITNSPPVAGDDFYSMDQNTDLTMDNPGVLKNDSDPEGDVLSDVLISSVSHGSLILNLDGSFTYTPATDFSGTDSFSYKVNDGINSSNTATVTITVIATANPIITGDDSYITEQNLELIIRNPGVLSNDSGALGDKLDAVLVSSVSHGSLILHADGSFNYTPATDFSGSDSFSYRVSDGINSSDTATVTINVSQMDMFDTIYSVVTDLVQLS